MTTKTTTASHNDADNDNDDSRACNDTEGHLEGDTGVACVNVELQAAAAAAATPNWEDTPIQSTYAKQQGTYTHQGLWLACDKKRQTHHCAWLCSHVSVQVQAKLAQERKAAQAQWERELRAEARRQKRLRGEVCDSDDDDDDTREPEAEATQPGTVLQQTCAPWPCCSFST